MNTTPSLRNLIEANTDTVLYSQGELWVTYGQSSGQTVQIGQNGKTFVTDKKNDPNFNSTVPKIKKWAKKTKPMDNNGHQTNMYKIPEYGRTKMGDTYDIWGGDKTPIGYVYLVMNVSSHNVYDVVNFFDNKNEAKAWLRSMV